MAGAARPGYGVEAADDRMHDLRPWFEPSCDGGRMLWPRRQVPLHDVARSSSSIIGPSRPERPWRARDGLTVGMPSLTKTRARKAPAPSHRR